jgi:two-component system sensor histidine kinase KdpD
LLIILFVATAWGPKPAVLASLLGAACFNFFFLPPVGTFHIAHLENWIALLVFLITGMTVGQLSSRAKLRADEATAARQEIERLYHELQDTFERSSQAKALKQSERLKSALLDAVTHDLRTPLTSIKASVTVLLNDLVEIKRGEGERLGDEGRQEMLEVINEEADRLDRFIGSLMDLARIEAGEMQLRRQSLPLDGIIIAAMKRAEPRTRDHRIEISLDDQLPPVNVDEAALVEAVYVLVDNAAKYSEPGSTIRVKASAKPGEGTARVVVEDEGKGIPLELRERVFDKFFRAMRDGDHSQPSGTGMGLAIAHGIVEAHGGRIWIEDGPQGRGTKFIVDLPINGPVKYA